MSVVNGLFQTFCNSNFFPLLRFQKLGCKEVKSVRSPFWYASIGLLPAELLEQWVRRRQKSIPTTATAQGTLARYNEVWKGKQQCLPFAQRGATQQPFHSRPSRAPKSMQHTVGSLLNVSLTVLSDAVIGIPEGTPRPCTVDNWRGNNFWDPGDWEMLCPENTVWPSERSDCPVLSPCH